MTRAYFTKKARNDIYVEGKIVKRTSKKGKRAGQEVEVRDRTQPANSNDKVLIKKGEPYYWWKFAFGPKIISKNRPSRSQLTQSGFLSQLYELEDNTIGNASAGSQSDLEALRDEWISEIESMRDECQDKRDNMPEQLQEVGSGEILGERVDALESWISDLEGVDLEIDEESLRAEAREELESEIPDGEEDEYEEVNDEDVEDLFKDKLQEKVDELLDELKGCSSEL